jgi:heme exporter protein C
MSFFPIFGATKISGKFFMINLLKQTWWKYMTVLILLYVLIGGLLVPLGPGITSVYPLTFASDSAVDFSLVGFGTHFQDAKDVQVWFKNGTDFYCAGKTELGGNDIMKVTFSFPKKNITKSGSHSFDVVVNDKLDGTISLRDAVTVFPIAVTDSSGDSSAIKATCTPEVAVGKLSKFAFPYREILYQSIRNTFYHVPMWFGMMLILIFSLVYSIRYLSSGRLEDDILASQAVNVALLFGALGLLTGMIWAKYTWGKAWPNDPKLNGAAVGVIIYLAYIVLRGSLTDEIKRAKISAVYSVFAIVIFVLFIFIIPRLTDSLHPGNGGNPAFSKYDLDSHLRLFFYPAVIGWTLLGFWILSIAVRIKLIELKKSSV